MIKIGVIGCGVIAKEHIHAIRMVPGARVVGLADPDEKALETLAAKFQIAGTYTDPAELIEKENPDAVHITTPPASHYDLTRNALESGCHVFLEKPMTLHAPEAEELVDIAFRVDRLLCVDHNHRFDAVVLEAQKLVDEGLIGRICSIDSFYGFDLGTTPGGRYFTKAYSHWAYELPGGLFHNGLDHPLSVVVPFMNEPKTVQATTAEVGVLPDRIPGELKIILNDGERVASVTLSEAASPRFHYLHLMGTKGTLQVDLQNKRIIRYGHKEGVPHFVTRALMNVNQGVRVLTGTMKTFWDVIRHRFTPYEGQRRLILEFYKAIESGDPSPLPPEDALIVTRIMDKVWEQTGELGMPKDASPIERWAPGRNVRFEKSGSGRRVLVTGATGFIGRRLIEKLCERGTDEVRGLVRNLHKASFLRDLPVEVIHGDLSDPDSIRKAVAGVDTVYHLGAAMGGTWDDFSEITVKGTERIARASLEANVKAFVLASSIAAYGIPRGKRITEDTPFATRELTDYIRSKIEAERILTDYVQNTDFPATILRLGVVFGPGRPKISRIGYPVGPRFYVVIGFNNIRIPSVYVDEAVDAILLAGERPEARGKIYNVVDDPRFKQTSYLRKMGQYRNRRTYYVFFPYTGAMLMGSVARGLAGQSGIVRRVSRLLNPFHLKSCAKERIYDNTRIKEELGWSPSGDVEAHFRSTFGNAP